MGEDIWAFGESWRGAGFVGAEHRFVVGNAGGEVEGYKDANEVRGEGPGLTWRHGEGGESTRTGVNRVGEADYNLLETVIRRKLQ